MQNLSFLPQIITSSSRKTISIQVYQDCTVKIRVPVGLSQKKINDIITKKEGWINKKIQHFQQNQKETISKKEYIDGEVFYYLGKPCKIKINEVNKKNSIEFNESIIIINKTPRRKTKNILTKWLLYHFNLKTPTYLQIPKTTSSVKFLINSQTSSSRFFNVSKTLFLMVLSLINLHNLSTGLSSLQYGGSRIILIFFGNIFWEYFLE